MLGGNVARDECQGSTHKGRNLFLRAHFLQRPLFVRLGLWAARQKYGLASYNHHLPSCTYPQHSSICIIIHFAFFLLLHASATLN